MAYTDDTVYNLRECLSEYSYTAIQLRNEKDYEEILDKFLKNNDIQFDEHDMERDNDTNTKVDSVIEGLNQCIEDYIAVRTRLNRQKQINQQKKELLEKNEIYVNFQDNF